jgi:hypothetical protein
MTSSKERFCLFSRFFLSVNKLSRHNYIALLECDNRSIKVCVSLNVSVRVPV